MDHAELKAIVRAGIDEALLYQAAIVMANARRLLAPAPISNQELASEIFALGSSSAAKKCMDLGLDPLGTRADLELSYTYIRNTYKS